MGETILQLGAQPNKYGVVLVYNPDGTVQREFRITGEALAELHSTPNGIPLGCTKEEWESGYAVCYGKDYDVGDIRIQDDGSLTIKVAEELKNGQTAETYVYLKAGEWSGTPPHITVTAKALTEMNQPKDKLPKGVKVSDKTITGISGGKIQWL